MKKISLMLALVVLLGVFVAACGEDDPLSIGFSMVSGTGTQELWFDEGGTFYLQMYSSERVAGDRWEGSFSDNGTGLVTMSGITQTSGTTPAVGLTGWTFAYTASADITSIFDSTAGWAFTFTYNGSSRTVTDMTKLSAPAAE